MPSSIPHVVPGRGANHPDPHPAVVPGSRSNTEGMADWAWIANRIGDCDPGHRRQESAVQRRNDALASAEHLMSLRRHQG